MLKAVEIKHKNIVNRETVKLSVVSNTIRIDCKCRLCWMGQRKDGWTTLQVVPEVNEQHLSDQFYLPKLVWPSMTDLSALYMCLMMNTISVREDIIGLIIPFAVWVKHCLQKSWCSPYQGRSYRTYFYLLSHFEISPEVLPFNFLIIMQEWKDVCTCFYAIVLVFVFIFLYLVFWF